MLNRLLYCILFCIATTNLQANEPTSKETNKPNILLLFTDDQCFDTIGALGHPEVKTPNLDRLARRGVSFTNCYNMGGWNGAICVASRTMMNTGRFLWRANEVAGKLQQEAEQGNLFSQLLDKAGYETFMTGKWHVKIDANKIFDNVTHVRPGMPKTVAASYGRPNDRDDWSPWDKSIGGFWEGGKHWSEVVADDASEFLKKAANSDQPFFMYLAFNAPHDPRQAPEKFIKSYQRHKIQIPANFMPQNPHMDAMAAGKGLRDEKLAPWPRTEEAVQLHRQEYYGLITHLDEQIGRILDQLEATGQADNTYIVMTADHGLACGQHGLLGKQNMYEHSMKAPMIVVQPGSSAKDDARTISTPVYVQDFMATALDIADAEVPDHVEFKSLLPIIRGERKQQYPVIYGAYLKDRQRMIRKGDHKLIFYPQSDTYLMFNVVEDPAEVNDLINEPDVAGIVAELKTELRELMHKMDDPMLSKPKK